MKIKINILKKFIPAGTVILFLALIVFSWEVYFPADSNFVENIDFVVQKGEGDEEVSIRLEKQGIIKNKYFFQLYGIISGNDSKIQVGKYSLSPSMTISEIIRKFASGDVIRQKITIREGWSIKDIEKYFVDKEIYSSDDFTLALNKDYSKEFGFLNKDPLASNFAGLREDSSLEGYLFPDTYNVSLGENEEDIIRLMLSNFNKKLNAGLREQIISQKKTIFEVITMASIIEKEVKSLDDKKIVAGILWKRLGVGMPLQVDSTINYITNKNDIGATLADTKIDSPYNTYKYKGLPKGPISNPGMDSILAAIYPTKSQYWYYLSDFDGKTIFSKTFADHNIAVAKYLK